jgi:PAS domain S-box-containing protein
MASPASRSAPAPPRLAAAGAAAARGGERPRERRRFRRLYEVSKLLLAFDGTERSTSSIFAALAEALALQSAVLLYEDGGTVRAHTWKVDAANLVALRLAERHAHRCYAYLTGGGEGHDARGAVPPAATATLPDPRPEVRLERDESLVALPSVVDRGRVFGALQLVVGGRLDEAGLLFIHEVVSHLAFALDRHLTSLAERSWAEGLRRELERRVAASEAAHGQAEEGRLLAEARSDDYGAQLDFSRALTDSLGEGVVAVDVEARVTFFNPAAERLLGWTESEALGAYAPELLRLQRAEGEAMRPDECPLLHALHTGKAFGGDEIMFVGHDDAPFPVSYTSAPIERRGRVAGAVLVFQNVTALKRSENAHHFLSEVSATLATSLDGEQTLATAARLAVPFLADACRLEELADDGAPARLAHADAERTPGGSARFPLEPRWREARAAALKTGRPVLVAEPFEPAPGGPRDEGRADLPTGGAFASMIVAPLRARGRFLGLLSLGTLGSGRRYDEADLAFAAELAHRAAMALANARSHEETQRAVRQRQDVLAIVSHDLRTPLSAILMGAAFLSDQNGDDSVPSRRKMFEMVSRSVAKMDRMLKDLLDMSSIDAGRLALERRPTAVGAFVEETLETLRPLAARKSLRLEARAPREGLTVTCDRWRVLQVLSNFVSNAIKFTPEGGAIEIRIDRCGPDVRFAVVDEGPGIARERLPHVFERYWQAEETATKGTGLGLYICKGIVESHGGAIGVESESGRGSTFYFTLPLQPPAAKADDVASWGQWPEGVEEQPPHSSERPAPPSLRLPSLPPARR